MAGKMRYVNRYFAARFIATLLGVAIISDTEAAAESLNAVGYITISIPGGGNWVQVATPFDRTGGNPMTLDDTFGDNFPNETTLQFYTETDYEVFNYIQGTWYNTSMAFAADYEIPRGGGCWLKTPSGTEAIDLKIAGQVPDDDPPLNTIVLDPGWNIFSFGFPTETPIEDANLLASNWDRIQLFVTGSGYQQLTYIAGDWYNADMTLAEFSFQPGQAYWYYNDSDSSLTWDQPQLY